MTEPALIAGDALAPAELHAVAVAAFADYVIGPFRVTLAQWAAFLARHAVDAGASRVALIAGRPVAFALVAPRPATRRWRLAMMGAVPEARGGRAAAALVDDFIARAGAAGVAEVELECIAQNARALKFYEQRGFTAACALQGWTQSARANPSAGANRAGPAGEASPEPRVVDCVEAFAWLDDLVRRMPDVPLQVTSPSLCAVERPLNCWRLGTAQLVFSAVDGTPTQVHSLVDRAPAQADAQALLRQLRAAHPAEDIVIPPLQRDDLGGDAARREGFATMAVHQLLMRRRA